MVTERSSRVRDIELVEAVAGDSMNNDHQIVGAVLARGDAVALHSSGKLRALRNCDSDFFLHQHLGLVEISAELEGDGDRSIARFEVSLAVEIQACPRRRDLLLLDRSCDGSETVAPTAPDGLWVVMDHRRRHHLRIFGGKPAASWVGERADDQTARSTAHREEGWLMRDGRDSWLGTAGAFAFSLLARLTLAPARARCRPSIITLSSAFRPSRITRRHYRAEPEHHGLASTVLRP